MTSQEIQRYIKKLYGTSDLEEPTPRNPSHPAILHVTAVHENESGKYAVIRVDIPKSPKNTHDFFLLNLARARADAIVTSGKIVRLEKELSHSLQGESAESLRDWRTRVLGKTEPPYSLIFTRGAPDLTAQIFSGNTRPIIYTSSKAAKELREKQQVREGRILVADGGKEPNISEALQYLKEELGVRVVSIEAGPSISNGLYNEGLVSELMLSVYRGELDEKAIGNPFILKSHIQEHFERQGTEYSENDWTFSRHLAK